jgi:hypothetical protein
MVTDIGVVAAIGVAAGASVSGIYSAATTTLPGKVMIHMASTGSRTAGEFCQVQFDIAAGSNIHVSDFAAPSLNDSTGFNTVTVSTVTGLEHELLLTASIVLH